MTRVKELARAIIKHEWHVTDDVFDTLWEALATIPPRHHPLAIKDGVPRPIHGATGFADPMTVGVFVLIQAAHDLPDAVPWDAFRQAIERSCHELDIKSMGVRLIIAGQQVFSDLPTPTTTTAPFARLYASDEQQPRTIPQDHATAMRARPEAYDIFIYHERNLSPGLIGEIYLRGRLMRKNAQPPTQRAPVRDYLNAREYLIIRHVTKNRNSEEQRFIVSLVEHCWRNPRAAADLRRQWDESNRTMFYQDTAGYRGTISKLNVVLQQFLGARLISATDTSVYGIEPPRSSCLIEEL